MTPQTQVPLDLSFRASLGREDFLLGRANENAVRWIDQWPEWPGSALVVFGPEGSGKSHLTEVWLKLSGGEFVARDMLEHANRSIFEKERPCVAVEDIDRGIDEEALLHLFNQVLAKNGFLLLTSRVAPKMWGMKLLDLSSRILALPSVEILEPDDALLEAVLRKLFSDRQIALRNDVVTYLISRIDRSFGAMMKITSAVDSASLASARPITVPLVREILTHE